MSISLRKKVLKAFAGVFTIGSPFRLNEVLRIAGIAGCLCEALDQAVVARTGVLKDGLQTAGAVDVGDCRQHIVL